jgi:two-component system cell cycle sensor histidine kinase/response regulator CckA
VLAVVACMLQGGGYNALLATNADAALRLVARESLAIDLVLLDVVMPEISGPDLAERILATRPDIKVLFMSGYIDCEVVRIKILDRGLELLAKPFTPDGLLESVERALNCPALCAAPTSAREASVSR